MLPAALTFNRFLRIILLIFLAPCFELTARADNLPAYFKEALAHFNPAIPPDWAYTITTKRDKESSVERFDPSLPADQQWSLLRRNDRPATAEECSRYASYRISASASTHATFHRGDIDLSSVQLVREDDRQAEFHARFREDLDDQMLRMLELRLTVIKQPAFIGQFAFSLTGAYSPVLTVKMLELNVETILSPPAGDRPALPLHSSSRFRGRVLLFKHIEEDTQTSYSDFTRVKPAAPSSAPPPP